MSESTNPSNESRTPGSHYQPSLGAVLMIVVLFVGAAFLMLRSPSSSTSLPSVTTAQPSATTVASGTHVTATTVVSRSQVRVQVANGTLTTGLARAYTQQLLTLKWDALPETNGPRVTATAIYFNPGFKWAADAIAGEIHVKATAVQPLNGQAPVSGAAGDDVIVILGPDVAIIQG